MERQFVCVRCLCDGRNGVPAVASDDLNAVCLEHLVDAWRREEFSRNNTSTEHE